MCQADDPFPHTLKTTTLIFCKWFFVNLMSTRSCCIDDIHLSGLTPVCPNTFIHSYVILPWHMRPDPNYHPCFSTRKLKQTPPNVVSVTLSELRWHCMPLGSASHSVQQVQWSQIKWGHVTQLGNPALLGLTYQSSYRSVHRGTGVVQ